MASTDSIRHQLVAGVPLAEQQILQDGNETLKLPSVREKHMEALRPETRYKRVSVLLLYWDKVSDDHVDTTDEVERLRNVFEKSFRYTVKKRSLNPSASEYAGRLPLVLLQKYLADAAYEVEGPNSLLIVYYAGHGNPSKDNELILSGGNNHTRNEIDRLICDETIFLERNLQSDVLLLFDCCFVARATAPRSSQAESISQSLQVFGRKRSVYIGASLELTRAPGKQSFTSALIYVLQMLSEKSNGFTTSALYQAIRHAPNFPSNQTPVLGERSVWLEQIVLAPLPLKAGEDVEVEVDDVVSTFSMNSLGSAATTLVGDVLTAANEFVAILLTDEHLETTFSTVMDYITSEKLREKVRDALRTYSIDLQQEASSILEKEAVYLVRRRRAYIAYRVCQRYDASLGQQGDEFDKIIHQSPEKRALLEKYLRMTSTIESGFDSMQGLVDGDKSDASSSAPSSEAGDDDKMGLSDLDRVKVFMVQSKAYTRFRQNIKDLILPHGEHEEQSPLRPASWSALFVDARRRLRIRGAETLQALQILSRPLVPPDHDRITWTCGCGDYRYADVHEYTTGGASRLQMAIRKSAATIAERNPAANGTQVLSAPPQAHFESGKTEQPSSNARSPRPGQSAAPNPASHITGYSVQQPPSPQIEHKFLLLCITISGATMLEHLSIGDLDNDQYMWDKIREQYRQTRRKRLWFQKIAVTRWLSSVTWLSWIFRAIDVTAAHSIRFVRFQLVPVAMNVRPWNIRSPNFPPEAEVHVKKTYHYVPCPAEVDPTGLNGELLHCLLKPGPHLDRFWLNYFPKKLKEMLQYSSSLPEVNTGWGIQIVEGINWPTVTLLTFVLTATSSLLGILYSAFTADVGGGFGMATFVATLPALGVVTLQLMPVS